MPNVCRNLWHLNMGASDRSFSPSPPSCSPQRPLDSYGQTTRYPADAFLLDELWTVPDPDSWTVSCGGASSADPCLKVDLLSSEVPLDDPGWSKEYELVLDALASKFKLEAVDDHSMHIAVQGVMGFYHLKRILKLFCVFEDIIDELRLEGDPPPVDSDVLVKIDDTKDFGKLCILLVPNMACSRNPSFFCKIYPELYQADGFMLYFNNHPTSLRPDDIISWMMLMGKFAQHTVDCDDDEIAQYRPSLDVFFDEIIRDEALAKRYDLRCSRVALLGSLYFAPSNLPESLSTGLRTQILVLDETSHSSGSKTQSVGWYQMRADCCTSDFTEIRAHLGNRECHHQAILPPPSTLLPEYGTGRRRLEWKPRTVVVSSASIDHNTLEFSPLRPKVA
ncbi:hypothetical protein OBBRIDRAFT_808467 [Obba rivulosa]|uniref:Uncharacterized protein n=1 Tax=Obba rivulosa TaxID=1052685 RepID=A0A8E2AP10_9APHY|nr:hypothetical protein OBBRIDRAFT_808467 [Obba rivulosa]